jgi:hypothetical protein
MKNRTAILWLLAFTPLVGLPQNLVWTKTLNLADSLDALTVGQDGSVAIAAGSAPILWYDRAGVLIGTPTNSNDTARQIEYLTKDTLITITCTGASNDVFHLEEDSSVTRTTIPDLYHIGMFTRPSVHPFNYPYFIQYSGAYTNFQVQLFDLTSPSAPRIVGDAVIGIHGKNLQIKWKTVLCGKYIVQTSTDLTNWTDYTGVLDGTGSSIVVNVPIDEKSDSIFARVLKL